MPMSELIGGRKRWGITCKKGLKQWTFQVMISVSNTWDTECHSNKCSCNQFQFIVGQVLDICSAITSQIINPLIK